MAGAGSSAALAVTCGYPSSGRGPIKVDPTEVNMDFSYKHCRVKQHLKPLSTTTSGQSVFRSRVGCRNPREAHTGNVGASGLVGVILKGRSPHGSGVR